MKPYVFNGTEYNDLNSLALAYKENFNLGIEDIYTNSKKLVKFLKERTNNKDRVKHLVDILALSKYKNNALTFVIFDFLDIKEVVINGETITFEEMIAILKRNPNVENNIIFSFIEDHGITRCYERMNPTDKNFKDMYFVERYYNHPFTYKYLTTLFDFEVKESFEAKVKSIIIEQEECFRRATKLMNTEDFLLWLAHKFGFKEAIKVASESNPVFYSLKLLKSLIDEDDLRKILADTFFWWLYDNFDKYEYTGKSQLIEKKFIDIKKLYSSYLLRIEKKEINKVSFDNYADISRSLYMSYLDFIYYFKEGTITINRKFDQRKYTPDKPYCYTYITEDYMKGKVIKLYSKETTDENGNTTQVDSSKVNDDYNEKPIENRPDNDEDIFFREKSNIASSMSFSTFVTLIGFLTTALFAIGVTLHNIEYSDNFVDIKEGFSLFNVIIGIAVGVITLGFGIYITVLGNKRSDALNDFKFYINANTKDYITLEQEERYYKIKDRIPEIKKKIIDRKPLLNALLGMLYGISVALIDVVLCALLASAIKKGQFVANYSKVYVKLIVLLAPGLLGFLFGLLKKKNVFLIILSLLINIGIVFAVLLFM